MIWCRRWRVIFVNYLLVVLLSCLADDAVLGMRGSDGKADPITAFLNEREEFRQKLSQSSSGGGSVLNGLHVDHEQLSMHFSGNCTSDADRQRCRKKQMEWDLKGVCYDNTNGPVFAGFVSGATSPEYSPIDTAEAAAADIMVFVPKKGDWMSHLHILVIPKRFIYNAISINKEDLPLIRRMKAEGERVINAIIDDPTNTKFADQPFLNSGKALVRGDISFAFHVHKHHSVGWLHMHVFLTDSTADDCSGYWKRAASNTDADMVIKAIEMERLPSASKQQQNPPKAGAKQPSLIAAATTIQASITANASDKGALWSPPRWLSGIIVGLFMITVVGAAGAGLMVRVPPPMSSSDAAAVSADGHSGDAHVAGSSFEGSPSMVCVLLSVAATFMLV